MNIPRDIQSVDAALWERARDRERVLRSLAGRAVSRREMGEAADALGRCVSWLYRLRQRFEADPRTAALTPAPGGRRRGARLLAPGVAAIVAAVIAGFYGSGQKPTLAATVREVARRCRESGLMPPGAETVRRRVRAADQLALACRREGRAAAQARLGRSAICGRCATPFATARPEPYPAAITEVLGAIDLGLARVAGRGEARPPRSSAARDEAADAGWRRLNAFAGDNAGATASDAGHERDRLAAFLAAAVGAGVLAEPVSASCSTEQAAPARAQLRLLDALAERVSLAIVRARETLSARGAVVPYRALAREADRIPRSTPDPARRPGVYRLAGRSAAPARQSARQRVSTSAPDSAASARIFLLCSILDKWSLSVIRMAPPRSRGAAQNRVFLRGSGRLLLIRNDRRWEISFRTDPSARHPLARSAACCASRP